MSAKTSADTPMSLDEAIAIARLNPELKRVLEGRARALFVEPVPASRGASDEEHVLLGLYDYLSDRALVALIDRSRKAVASVQESRAHFQLANEEREEAERLAGTDEGVRAFLRGRPMQPLTRLYLPRAGRGDAGHRYAIVFLRPTSRERAYAVVDLTDGRLTELISHAAFTEQRHVAS